MCKPQTISDLLRAVRPGTDVVHLHYGKGTVTDAYVVPSEDRTLPFARFHLVERDGRNYLMTGQLLDIDKSQRVVDPECVGERDGTSITPYLFPRLVVMPSRTRI